ncbi:hypothetical protein IQ241_05145 [Romeria aff. gracilis LEGE 07310]|uniref:DUF6816 domain-containing protein n=1 Tax=Vasconcelosia minhoensis LEGE 07310 TaxID=915328 RepID=A0A8J7DBP0_9CYAN|nr:hypothetical protein [Romeria gracilis]MBE9076688.1 hypothetical protein [Romeria aff. gracilis LEGE 07310]
MNPLLWRRIRRNLLWIALLLFVWLTCSGQAQAGALSERLAKFSNWQTKPPVATAAGDLIYPDWMVATWQMTTTLVDMAAPLAPTVVTPGFDGNRQFLPQPVTTLKPELGR